MRSGNAIPFGDTFFVRHGTVLGVGAITLLMGTLALLALNQPFSRDYTWLMILLIAMCYTGVVFFFLTAARHWQHAVHMETDAAASRAFLANIMDHVIDPIFVKDRQHRWIHGNAAFWKLMDKPPEELIGKSDYEFFPKEQADVFWQKDEEVFSSHMPNINVEKLTGPDGVIHTISTKKACFRMPDGSPILVGVIRDITELAEMQEKLKQTDEARLKSIMDHSGKLLYIKDLEGKYLQVNKELLALIRIPEKEVIGKTDKDLFPPLYAELYRRNDRLVIEKGEAIEFEEPSPHWDGTEHIYTSMKFPLYDANHQIYATCGITTDITDRKQAEGELKRYMQALERSNQELDDFAYIASHDLKEPLRGLHNHASFLIEDFQDKLGEDGARRLQRLAYLSQRMEQLVSDLLYFSRLGRTELAVQDTDPNHIIMDIQQMLDPFLKERNAHITVPKPMPRIVCDRLRITEVLRNLITNAVKYNDKPERRVEVGFLDTVKTPHGLERNVFYVRDNGVGIDAEFHEEIFRIFRRLARSTEEKEDGTGTGLTFVKKIIDRHHGRIWLESEPDKGTTFYFNLNQEDSRHEQLAA